MELEYLKELGRTETAASSNVNMLLVKGMGLVEVDGTVKVDGQPLDFFGSGVYAALTDVKPGQTFKFELEGTGGDKVSFEETYNGTELAVTKPADGESIDLSKGFDVEWTAGSDPKIPVVVQMFGTQIGIETFGTVGIFPDTGKATVTPDMIRDAFRGGTKISRGKNSVIVERRNERIDYVMAGDAVVSAIDGDVAPVNVIGDPPDYSIMEADIEPVTAKKGDVEVKIDGVGRRGMLVPMERLKKLALTSFVLKGKTAVSETTTTQTAIVTTTWHADLGKENLQKIADIMADRFMTRALEVFGAEEVPTATVMATKGYQAMVDVNPESDKSAFYITARGLTSFEGFKQLKFKIGGQEAWYYDIQEASGADGVIEVYFDLARKKPQSTKEFTFDVTARVDYKAYPYRMVSPRGDFPGGGGSWTSDSFEWKDGMPLEDVLTAIKFQDFLDAYFEALGQFKQVVVAKGASAESAG